jgi:hypothetical protein
LEDGGSAAATTVREKEAPVQDQYFGNVGDFVKFGLLRHLLSASKPTSKLGVIWYRTPNGMGNEGDGKHANYLEEHLNRTGIPGGSIS